MTPNLMLLLLLQLVVTVTAGKYIYVQVHMNWFDAQTYCRTYYTDLAPVSNEYDQSLLNKMISGKGYIWIGLMRITSDRTKWMWSGGSEVTECFWGHREPDGINIGEEVALIYNNMWADVRPSRHHHFFCYKVHAIRKRMTWEEALQYCRKNHHDLASVASETEMMLMEKELRKELSSANVWIGLRFLAGEWLWVDGQPFRYESWGPLEKPMCLDMDLSCGALRLDGQRQKVEGDTLIEVEQMLGWNAHGCNLKKHFLCY